MLNIRRVLMVACKCLALFRIESGLLVKRHQRAKMLTRSGAKRGAHTTTARCIP